MMRSLAIAVFVVFTALPAVTAPPSYKNFEKALDAIERREPATADEIRKIFRQDQPYFIIVPGILGSKLLDGKEIVWGSIPAQQLLRSHPDRLSYPTHRLTPDVMMTFEIAGNKLDVYGPLIRAIDSLDISDIEHYTIFPYDWRQNVMDSAALLDQLLRSPETVKKIGGRDVVFISHSMGGLVTTAWYHQYYSRHRDQYSFPVTDFFMVGVPNRGAASSLVAIAKGYQPGHPSWIEKKIYSFVFNDLNQAAVTFPGLFDLLPAYSAVREVDKYGGGPVEIFDLKPWLRYDWGGSARKARGEKPDAFYETFVKPMLERSSALHALLRTAGLLPIQQTYYFYSRKHSTVTKVDMTVHGTAEKPQFEFTPQIAKEGDERVPMSSAVPSDIATTHPDHAIELQQTHGGLPNDDTFVEYVRNFRWSHIATTNRLFIELAKQHPVIMEEMRKAGAALELPGTVSSLSSPEAKATAQFNVDVAPAIDSADDAYSAAKTAGGSTRAQLLATAVALGGTENRAQQVEFNLGVALLNSDRPAAAIEHFLLAASNVPRLTDESRNQYLGKVHANLGVAYERTGQYTRAEDAYRKAIALSGYPQAKRNLAVLKANLVAAQAH